jgi:hypothetical protein
MRSIQINNLRKFSREQDLRLDGSFNFKRYSNSSKVRDPTVCELRVLKLSTHAESLRGTAIAALIKQKTSTSAVAKTSQVYMFSNRVDFKTEVVLEKKKFGVKWDQGYHLAKKHSLGYLLKKATKTTKAGILANRRRLTNKSASWAIAQLGRFRRLQNRRPPFKREASKAALTFATSNHGQLLSGQSRFGNSRGVLKRVRVREARFALHETRTTLFEDQASEDSSVPLCLLGKRFTSTKGLLVSLFFKYEHKSSCSFLKRARSYRVFFYASSSKSSKTSGQAVSLKALPEVFELFKDTASLALCFRVSLTINTKRNPRKTSAQALHTKTSRSLSRILRARSLFATPFFLRAPEVSTSEWVLFQEVPSFSNASRPFRASTRSERVIAALYIRYAWFGKTSGKGKKTQLLFGNRATRECGQFLKELEFGASARITTDGYCGTVNTLQWFARLSDQLLCQVLASKGKSGRPDTTYWKIVNKRRYKIIRPLLNLSRGSLTTLCKDLRLPVYPDKSNKAVQYSRNRLREQILPAIKLLLNPQIEDALFKLAELLTQDFFVVSHLVNTGRPGRQAS